MYNHRRKIWVCIAIILLFFLGFDSHQKYLTSIEPQDVYYYVDESLKESFADITDNESILLRYNFLQSEELSNANIVLTSDITKINTQNDFEVLGTSPLIMAMKNSSDLNNFRTANTKAGWINTVSKINNNESDSIKCDFKRVFDVIIAGGDWSNLGGADEEIKIYCPDLKTQEGQTFKKFLLQIVKVNETEVKKFFSSPNVIQTDVISRIEELENNIPSNELYIAFESDFLDYVYKFEADNSNLNLSFIYPEHVIFGAIYLQYNNVNEELQEYLANDYFDFSELEGHYGVNNYFYLNKYYRNFKENEYTNSERFQNYNFQKGISTFEYEIYVKID